MTARIQLRRGNAATLPTTGMLPGEPIVALDTQAVYVAMTPTSKVELLTRAQADQLIQGLSWKRNVVAATTANITLSAPQTIDAIAVIAGDRVLVKDQTLPAENGIYIVNAAAWTRATDAETSAEITQATVFVSQGTVNADSAWTLTTDAPVLGTSPLTFVQFSGAGQIIAGLGLVKNGNTMAVDLSEFPTAASVAAADEFVIQTAAGTRRVAKPSVFTDADTKTIKVTATDTTAKFLDAAVAATAAGGISKTRLNPAANESLTFALDIPSMTAAAANSVLATDVFAAYSGAAHKKVTAQDIVSNVVIDGGTF